MKLRALLVVAGLGLTAFAPAYARNKTPQSTNANVKRAVKKAKKTKATGKYKAPKRSKKPARARYGVSHT